MRINSHIHSHQYAVVGWFSGPRYPSLLHCCWFLILFLILSSVRTAFYQAATQQCVFIRTDQPCQHPINSFNVMRFSPINRRIAKHCKFHCTVDRQTDRQTDTVNLNKLAAPKPPIRVGVRHLFFVSQTLHSSPQLLQLLGVSHRNSDVAAARHRKTIMFEWMKKVRKSIVVSGQGQEKKKAKPHFWKLCKDLSSPQHLLHPLSWKGPQLQ